MRILQANQTSIQEAAKALRQGLLVALPTETVYGLGADATSEKALERLYAAKGRPTNHPVIVHLASSEQLTEWASSVPPGAWQLARALWPGPLTLILPRAAHVPNAVTGGQDTVGLRVPNHPIAHALLVEFGKGIAAPSANKFGRLSPTTAEDVASDFADEVEIVLDGGPCEVGIESTIVDFSDEEHPRILRPGMILPEQIEAILGSPVDTAFGVNSKPSRTRAPGGLPSHYAPNTPLRTIASHELQQQIESLLASGQRVCVLSFQPRVANVPWIAAPSRASEYAQQLYSNLRKLDREKADLIVVESVPETNDWAGISDRLRRAAAEAHLTEGGSTR
jgi:L-threonylcarbamoyladenylate synthase